MKTALKHNDYLFKNLENINMSLSDRNLFDKLKLRYIKKQFRVNKKEKQILNELRIKYELEKRGY